ncbi:MAG: hypothetical protein ACTSV3_01575 [Candidatus Thorarchaeota archaeon]|nr:MAG: hypothetical protein DRP09_09470 [Candidatus Thorarchaeota archaeon]RLI58521.1 MAG: hypothetical protein DRO87_05450 [Candidatus Thorarchaeota archaeon]
MSDEKAKKELEEAVMDEFEWALQDPNERKIRQLGEVMSIITTKLTEAITSLQITVMDLESQVSALQSKISTLERTGVAAKPSAAAEEGATPSDEPIPTMAAAPKPKPAPAGGGMSMMGELKALLAARRRKAESSE